MKLNIKKFIKDIFSGEHKRQREETLQKELYKKQLLHDINYITERLTQIQESYDLVYESELIDAIIYEEKALKAKYAYLLRLAKEIKAE